jgi:hypothetical protein
VNYEAAVKYNPADGVTMVTLAVTWASLYGTQAKT